MAIRPSNKTVSRDISTFLDELGFDNTQKWERIHHQNIQTRVKNISMKICINTNNERVFAGSTQEGIGYNGLADLDVLQVEHAVICIEQTCEPRVPNGNKLAFRIKESNAPYGYCLLELIDSATRNEKVKPYKYALVKRNDKIYMSSKLFVTKQEDDNLKVSEYMETHTRYNAQNGPSTPKIVSKPIANVLHSWLGINVNNNIDFVRALPCDGQLALKSWQQRPRLSWPSKKIIRHIMTLPVYVVPVGLHGTCNEDIQWRISFVRAETYLVQTLNSVQTKILVLLKLVGKHYLEEGEPCITSYMLKNVMLWLAESVPQKKFRQKNLVARLKDAFVMLRNAVKTTTLSSYMQPEKNLFANKLNTPKQQQVLDKIEYLLRNANMLVYASLYDEYSDKSRCNAIVNELALFNLCTKLEICKVAIYPFQKQVFYYLTTYMLHREEEQCLNEMSTLPKYILKYGANGFTKTTTVNLYKSLADSDSYERNIAMGNEMLQNADAILKDVSNYCALVWFTACFLRPAVILCKMAKYVWAITVLILQIVGSFIKNMYIIDERSNRLSALLFVLVIVFTAYDNHVYERLLALNSTYSTVT